MKHSVAILTIGLLAFTGERVARNFVSHPSASDMARAGARFLQLLNDDLRKKAKFTFDDAERYKWNFVPGAYPGVLLSEMSPEQRVAAHDLLRSALSSQGYLKVTSIFALDFILRQMSEKAGAPALFRDAERYSFAIFGEPDVTKPWGWRVQGHHVSLQFTSVSNELVCHTPMFLGANPATVKDGPSAGLRVLAFEEDLGRALVKSLSNEQKSIAIIDTKAPADIILGPSRKTDFMSKPVGIAASKLDAEQKKLLISLLELYIHNLHPDLSAPERARILDGSFDTTYFAWAGGTSPGEGHYYRLHSPLFIIEYDNTQDGANHPHTVWRDPSRDFGGDPLAEHLRKEHGAKK